MPLITVIIATSGRLSLEKTLAALDAQTIPKKDFVVHIIENSVQPSLKPLIEKFKSKLQLVYDVQRTPGKSSALNHGIRSSASELIAFTDDDCIPAQNWLQMILQTFEKYPDTACVSGTFALVPHMLYPYRSLFELEYNHPFTARGFKLRPWEIARGGNLAVRRGIFHSVGLFDPHFGPGAKVSCGEETEWLLSVLECGFVIRHDPKIHVAHNPPWGKEDHGTERIIEYYSSTGAIVAKHLLRGQWKGALSLVNPFTYILGGHEGKAVPAGTRTRIAVRTIPYVCVGILRYMIQRLAPTSLY